MPANTFRFPTVGSSAEGRAVLLAIDDYSLPLRKNLCYYLSKPEFRDEPVLSPQTGDPNTLDAVAAHFYGTVLLEDGLYRMWYYSLSRGEGPDGWREGPVCYAESADGLTWDRPNLGQVKDAAGRDTNGIALPDKQTEGVFIIRDDEERDPKRRYKMVYENHAPRRSFMSVRTATSPDGIHWTPGPELPVDEGLEPCSFYKHGGLYITNCQSAPYGVGEGGHQGGRQGVVAVSPDFRTWVQAIGESFLLPEPADPKARGLDKPYDQVHLGVAPVSQGNVLVGLYCIWHAVPGPGDWFGQGTTSGDWGLVVSNDGQHFREPVKGQVYVSRKDVPFPQRRGVKFEKILCQGNGILNVGDKTLIYHGQWANAKDLLKDYRADVGLATLPRDRWGALGLFPSKDEGSVWTAPVTLPKAAWGASLNADGVAGMRLEIADERFGLIPEFSGKNAGRAGSKDGLDRAAKWTGDVARLAGKTVRFRLNVKRGKNAEPRVYAMYLTA